MQGDLSSIFAGLNVERLIFAVFVLVVAILGSRVLSTTLDRIAEAQPRRRLLLKKVSSIVRFLVFILASVIIVTNVFSFSQEALLALGGTMAVTIGFALKDTVASLVSGVLILLDQPFQVGDRITFGPHYGEVKEIGLRMVRIVTLDDNLISIPTNKFLIEEVASGNAGALDMMVVIDLHIGVEADFARAKQIAYEATVTSKYVYLNKPVVVLVSDEVLPTGLATQLRIKAYVVDVRFERRFASDVTERVKQAFREAAIRPPSVSLAA